LLAGEPSGVINRQYRALGLGWVLVLVALRDRTGTRREFPGGHHPALE
jgi:hypothetical protein